MLQQHAHYFMLPAPAPAVGLYSSPSVKEVRQVLYHEVLKVLLVTSAEVCDTDMLQVWSGIPLWGDTASARIAIERLPPVSALHQIPSPIISIISIISVLPVSPRTPTLLHFRTSDDRAQPFSCALGARVMHRSVENVLVLKAA